MSEPGLHYLALKSGRNVKPNPIAAMTDAQPKNLLDTLTKPQIIEKLAALPWVETRTGVPGIALHSLTEDESKFLAGCLNQKLVTYVRGSSSLQGNPAYYTYTPEVVEAIIKKEGFTSGNKHRALHNFLLQKVPTIAYIMDKHFTADQSRSSSDSLLIPDNAQAAIDDIIDAVRTAPQAAGLHLPHRIVSAPSIEGASQDDSGGTEFHFDRGGGIGDAILTPVMGYS